MERRCLINFQNSKKRARGIFSATACWWTKPLRGEKISAASVLISIFNIPGFLKCTYIHLNGGRR